MEKEVCEEQIMSSHLLQLLFKESAAISKKTTMDSLSLTTRSSLKYKVFCILCIQLSISDR